MGYRKIITVAHLTSNEGQPPPSPPPSSRNFDWLTCLVPGEQLLFSSEQATIYEISVRGPFRSGGLFSNLFRLPGGPLAITDRRVLIRRPWEPWEPLGAFVYDPNTIKEYIELAKAKNKKGNMFVARALTAAKLYKRLLTALDLDTAEVWINIPKGIKIRKRKYEKYELFLFKPLRTHTDFQTTKAAILDSGSTTFWFTPIISHYMEKTDVRYEPILELVQAKAQEMSDLIKELEGLSRLNNARGSDSTLSQSKSGI